MKRRMNMRWLFGLITLLASCGLTETVWAECRALSTAPSYTAGQLKDLTCGTDGALSVGGKPGSATAAAPTFTEGSAGSFSFDLAGNVRITPGTQLGGEHIGATEAEGYIRTRGDFLSSGQKTADAQILATPGYVSHMICQGTDAAAVAGTIILHDSLTEAGTSVFTFTVSALDYHSPIVFPIMSAFATGIYLGYTTTSDVNCTVFYR